MDASERTSVVDSHSPLQIFLAVVRERSFTRAAEKLFRSQPAVSLAVQRLEAELGEKLLDRSGRELRLTEAGRLVFECASRQQNLMRELVNALSELRHKTVGRLVTGANESMTLYLLPYLTRFRRRYPRVKLLVQRHHSQGLPETLLRGDVDFGVLSFRPEGERFETIAIYKDHLSFVVPPGHRLAKRKMVSIADLGVETFVAHHVDSPYRDRVINEFARHRIPLNMDIEMPTIESIRLLVQAGEGVAFLPRMTVERDLALGLLKEVRVKEMQLEREILLVWVAKRPLSHAGQAFLDSVRAVRAKSEREAARAASSDDAPAPLSVGGKPH